MQASCSNWSAVHPDGWKEVCRIKVARCIKHPDDNGTRLSREYLIRAGVDAFQRNIWDEVRMDALSRHSSMEKQLNGQDLQSNNPHLVSKIREYTLKQQLESQAPLVLLGFKKVRESTIDEETNTAAGKLFVLEFGVLRETF